MSPDRGVWRSGLVKSGSLIGPAAAFAFAAITCAYYVASFHIAVFDGDEYTFALVARAVLHGKLPNTGVFDNKPVGVTYLFALAEWLGGQSFIAIRALGFIASLASGALLYQTSRRLGFSRSGGVLIACLFMLEALWIGVFSTRSELLACPFLAAGNYLLVSAKRTPLTLLGLGVAFGVACQASYLAAPCAILTVLGRALLDPGRSLKSRLVDFSLIVVGGGAAASAFWIPQLITGDWAGYVADQFSYHQSYRLQSFSWDDWMAGFAAPAAAIALPIVLLFGLRWRGGVGAKPVGPLVWILALQWLGAALAAMASNRFYPHYLILCLPATSVIAALLLADISRPKRVIGWAPLVAMAIVSVAISSYLLQLKSGNPGIEVEASAAVDRLTRPDQNILVFNETPTIYYLAQRPTSGRFVFPSHYLTTCDHAPTIANAASVLGEALARRPALVLLGQLCPREIDAETQIQKAGYRPLFVLQSAGRRIVFNAPTH